MNSNPGTLNAASAGLERNETRTTHALNGNVSIHAAAKFERTAPRRTAGNPKLQSACAALRARDVAQAGTTANKSRHTNGATEWNGFVVICLALPQTPTRVSPTSSSRCSACRTVSTPSKLPAFAMTSSSKVPINFVSNSFLFAISCHMLHMFISVRRNIHFNMR